VAEEVRSRCRFCEAVRAKLIIVRSIERIGDVAVHDVLNLLFGSLGTNCNVISTKHVLGEDAMQHGIIDMPRVWLYFDHHSLDYSQTEECLLQFILGWLVLISYRRPSWSGSVSPGSILQADGCVNHASAWFVDKILPLQCANKGSKAGVCKLIDPRQRLDTRADGGRWQRQPVMEQLDDDVISHDR
jgi:hypothetical protein